MDNTGLKCPHGTYRHSCPRPVTKMSTKDVQLFEGITTDPKVRKQYDGVDTTRLAENAMYCALHAAAANRSYRGPLAFLSIFDAEPGSTIDMMLKKVRREYDRRADEARKAHEERVRENQQRADARTERLWREQDEEPEYEVTYAEKPHWSGERVDRAYYAYTPDVPAERRDDSGSFAALTVEIDDRDESHPAYVNLRSSSNLTPKAARVYADMLIKAAALAEATTAERKAGRAM